MSYESDWIKYECDKKHSYIMLLDKSKSDAIIKKLIEVGKPELAFSDVSHYNSIKFLEEELIDKEMFKKLTGLHVESNEDDIFSYYDIFQC